MTTQIDIQGEGGSNPFTLDWESQRWQSVYEPKESDFPLIAVIEAKRYELYSDKTFAEVEL